MISGSFREFINRVMSAAGGKLQKKDSRILQKLFDRTRARNVVLARGLLSALNAGGANEKDIRRFSSILEKANSRIEQEQEPFTESERNEISGIFQRSSLSQKTTRWFAFQLDELLASELEDMIKGKTSTIVPAKKTFELTKRKIRQ